MSNKSLCGRMIFNGKHTTRQLQRKITIITTYGQKVVN